MPKLIRLESGQFRDVEDEWRSLADSEAQPSGATPVILSIDRLSSDESFGGRALGVVLTATDTAEALAPHLDRVCLVALTFAKFRDGRALSAAALLRERHGFAGELRAVGEVLQDQAFYMVRCGFDAFAPADGSDAVTWTRAARLHRHVYQRAQDGRAPVFAERAS